MPIAEARGGYATIREQAVALFVNKGFGQVGMRELARHVGVAPGSLYHYFPSKQHLLFDLIDELYEELHWLVRSLAPKVATGKRTVPDVIRAHLQLHRERPLQFQLASHGFIYLDAAQQQLISHQYARYEDAFLRLIFSESLLAHPSCAAAGRAITRFLNGLAGAPGEQPLTDDAWVNLVERMIECFESRCAPADAASRQ
ncbi:MULTISPECIES: TetR/AcrR family transcriptional regulator [Pseudomonas]|uniref:TetR/AcrR family transcriptional regulator n=1 Tax=Pseudomonas sp. P97.38 TaxID=255451 RepID=UPI00069D6051|nr:TetR/AcrR family transcriptional regulator [Pseudomonas sp. P97.38]